MGEQLECIDEIFAYVVGFLVQLGSFHIPYSVTVLSGFETGAQLGKQCR